MQLTLLEIGCLITVLIAVATDLYNNKIPNWLTFSTAFIALIMQYSAHGIYGAVWGLAGWILGVVLVLASKFAPMLLRRQYGDNAIGFGDVKLFGAIGAFLGPHRVVLVFFFFCVFYGIHAIFRILKVVLVIGLPLLTIGTLAFKTKQTQINEVMRSKIPLAPAIAMAVITAIFFVKPILNFFGW